MTRAKALVLPDIDPKYGGPSVSVPALARAMHALDDSLRFYFASDRVDPAWPDYFRRAPNDWPRVLRRSRGLRTALEQERFSVVHHQALWLPSLHYASRAAMRSECPLVISPRGALSKQALAQSRLKKGIAKLVVHPGAMRGAAGWHATSPQEADDIRRAGYVQPVVVSPNGVSVPDWNGTGDRTRWLTRHPELANKRVVLAYSRLHPLKGIDELLAAWSRLAPSFTDWHVLIAGIPSAYTVADVQSMAARLDLKSRVTVSDSQHMPKPYRLAELFVLPTHTENFGLTVAESLVSGVAVLTTTNAPWSRINEIGCGVCAPLEEFESQFSSLLSCDSQRLHEMGERGRVWATNEFSWDRQARDLLQFYDSLMRA